MRRRRRGLASLLWTCRPTGKGEGGVSKNNTLSINEIDISFLRAGRKGGEKRRKKKKKIGRVGRPPVSLFCRW